MQKPCEDEVKASVVSDHCDIRADFSDKFLFNYYLSFTDALLHEEIRIYIYGRN